MEFKKRLYAAYTSQHVRFDSDTLDDRRPYLTRLVSQCFPTDRRVRVIDLGCGYGALLKVLQTFGYDNCSGVDTSPEQVGVARSLGIKNISEGDIYEFLTQLPDGSVDVVVAFDILEHLADEDLLNIGDQISRVLTSGGRCVIHVPNAGGIFGSAVVFGDLTHERAFTPSSLSQFAENIGLKLEKIFEDTPPVDGIRSLVRRLLWSVSTLPFRLVCLAETGTARAPLSQNMLAVVTKR